MMEIILASSILLTLVIAAKPKIGIYLMAAFLPVIGRDFYLYGFVIPAADLVALCTFVGWLLHLLHASLFKPQEKIKLSWPLFFPFAVFFLINIISIIVNGNSGESWYYFLRWPIFLYLAYIVAPANIIKNPKVLKNTVIIVTLSSLLVLLSGLLSLFAQDWQSNFFRLKSIFAFNSYPFGENHNLVAEFLNIGAFFILIIKEFLKSKKARRVADVLFLSTALGIVLTFSRTGWITLFLQSAVYVYFRIKHQPREKTASVILFLFLAIIATPLMIRMNTLQSYNVSSTENRVLLTEISIEAFKEKPLFGHGPGTFVSLVEKNTRFTVKYGPPVDSHGVIQKTLAENGIFGLLSWLFILLFLVRFSIIAIKKYYPKVSWVLPFALAAFGGIFFQFFNTSYYKGKVWFPLLLFILAIKFSEEKYGKKDKSTPHPTKLN